MKSLIAFIFAFAFATLSWAQPPQPDPPGKVAANVAVALTLGGVVSAVALLTGNVPKLCSALKGTYTPTGPDRCPDGQWRNLLITH